jgi:molybdenum cofactor cytidylyltransferase
VQLLQALRLTTSSRVAFAGAGGKTTAMFQLARQLPPPVLVSATTHLACCQLSRADQHFFILDKNGLDVIRRAIPKGVLLFTGEVTESDRTAGLDEANLEELRHLADEGGLPLLIEADGSRQRPFKAPAEFEPPIPAWVDTVIYVVGLSALGQAFTPYTVHRFEQMVALTGLKMGDMITPKVMQMVLTDLQGGMKNIPAKARRVVLLNQADTPELQAQAFDLARALIPPFDAVLVSALAPFEPMDDPGAPVFAVHEPNAGVLLAGGAAERMGVPKQLLEWRGEPFIRHAARAGLRAGLSPLIVVTGAYAGQVSAALADMPVKLVHNPDWQAGQSTSALAGVKALPDNTGSAIFLHADQPQVPEKLLRSLVEDHSRSLAPLIAPLVNDRRGTPVLFDRVAFPYFAEIKGDVGGKPIFAHFPMRYVPWHDESLLLDVDTPEDYRRLQEILP